MQQLLAGAGKKLLSFAVIYNDINVKITRS